MSDELAHRHHAMDHPKNALGRFLGQHVRDQRLTGSEATKGFNTWRKIDVVPMVVCNTCGTRLPATCDLGDGERVGYLVVAVVAGLIFLIASAWYLLGLIRSFLKDVLPGRRAQVACVLQAFLFVGAIVVDMAPLIIITAPLLLLMVSARMADRSPRAGAA